MIRIEEGNCQILAETLPDRSVDLIFTDPPYLKEYLYLYDWLVSVTPRILKPDGFLAMYVGVYHLANVIKIVGDRLDYFLELVIFGSGYGSMMWNRKAIGRHKSILLYRPIGGTAMPRCQIVSLFNGSGSDKRYHAWGQDEASARYYIDCLSKPGDLVLDPFCGGGTTAAMCKVLNRDCVSYEVDPATARIARVDMEQMPLDDGILQTPALFVDQVRND